MKYEIITNKEQWEKFYYYSPYYKPRKYPKVYPCIAKKEECDYGVIGCEYIHFVKYIPVNISEYSPLESYIKGLEDGSTWISVC